MVSCCFFVFESYIFFLSLRLMLFLTSVIFGMYADDSYSFVQKDEMDRCIIETEGQVSHAVSELFLEVFYKFS